VFLVKNIQQLSKDKSNKTNSNFTEVYVPDDADGPVARVNLLQTIFKDRLKAQQNALVDTNRMKSMFERVTG
jgi:hypothetical protein